MSSSKKIHAGNAKYKNKARGPALDYVNTLSQKYSAFSNFFVASTANHVWVAIPIASAHMHIMTYSILAIYVLHPPPLDTHFTNTHLILRTFDVSKTAHFCVPAIPGGDFLLFGRRICRLTPANLCGSAVLATRREWREPLQNYKRCTVLQCVKACCSGMQHLCRSR